MEVVSERRHSFAATPTELWAALSCTQDYQRWWPWLRRFDGNGFGSGACWVAVVQPPLPYRLRFEVTLDEVVAERSVAASVTGDITGSARLELRADGAGSALHLRSSLAPSNAVLSAVARVAAPVAQFGHDWVLDTGLRQFRRRALR